ncbi:MAG: bifunctional nuclease domain-containing protein [Opitutales bacterium]
MADCKKAKVVHICPTPFGHAVFLKVLRKVFVIYMDKVSSSNLDSAITRQKSERPTTHDLVMSVLDAVEAKIDKVVIDFEEDGVFQSTMYITMENEIGKKLIELDSRPSDALSFAIRQKAPIYILSDILLRLEDVSELLKELKEED